MKKFKDKLDETRWSVGHGVKPLPSEMLSGHEEKEERIRFDKKKKNMLQVIKGLKFSDREALYAAMDILKKVRGY